MNRLNHQHLQQSLDELAHFPGLRGCALVEADTGLVWSARGALADRQSLWEAAIDYWRLHTRNQRHFEALGELGAAVLYHQDAVLATFKVASEPALLFVAVGGHRQVDWLTLQKQARQAGEGLTRAR